MSLQEDPCAQVDRVLLQVRRICDEYGYDLDRVTWTDEQKISWTRGPSSISLTLPESICLLSPHLREELISKLMYSIVTGSPPDYSEALRDGLRATSQMYDAMRGKRA